VFFWFIYPGAYVKVDARVLVQVSIRKQLRILLAGVWHNLVLVAVVMLLLASGLLDIPWSWLGWERANSGVAITDIVTVGYQP
jgi:S2P endopeptidase